MPSVINSQTYATLKDPNQPFLFILKRGEETIATIKSCAQALKLKGAALVGLGALEDPTIAYYNLETQQYEEEKFIGIYELLSVNGNIAYAETGEVIVHLHVTLADDKHQVIGGHLVHALVGITAEITVIPLPFPVIRKFNAEVGLKVITPT